VDQLPPGFEALADYAQSWGRCTNQEQRYMLRQQSSMEALRTYYDTAAPMLDRIFDHLDGFPMDDLPPAEETLYHVALGLTEAAMAIEVFGQPGVPYAPFPHKMAIDWSEHE
jgi:hypothetical protein